MPTEAPLRAPLFQALASETRSSRRVTLSFNGEPLSVPAGISVAAALLLSGIERFRATPVSESPRAPYCMMGVCFECLVEIDGRQNQQACLTPAQDGMVVRRQIGARQLS